MTRCHGPEFRTRTGGEVVFVAAGISGSPAGWMLRVAAAAAARDITGETPCRGELATPSRATVQRRDPPLPANTRRSPE